VPTKSHSLSRGAATCSRQKHHREPTIDKIVRGGMGVRISSPEHEEGRAALLKII
jgi:hypothetical protein